MPDQATGESDIGYERVPHGLWPYWLSACMAQDRVYLCQMTDSSTDSVLNLFRASAFIEERFTGTLSAVHGLALNELLLMLYVQSAPGQRLSRIELSKRLHVSPSTITRMARPLEKLGILAREPDKRDARLAYVVLTKAGQSKLEEAKITLTQMSRGLFDGHWISDDISKLNSLLSRVTMSLPGDLSCTLD